jgi:hypothetical protein
MRARWAARRARCEDAIAADRAMGTTRGTRRASIGDGGKKKRWRKKSQCLLHVGLLDPHEVELLLASSRKPNARDRRLAVVRPRANGVERPSAQSRTRAISAPNPVPSSKSFPLKTQMIPPSVRRSFVRARPDRPGMASAAEGVFCKSTARPSRRSFRTIRRATQRACTLRRRRAL